MALTRTSVFLLAFLGIFLSAGCMFPVGSESLEGPNHSNEALAFLDQPGATRQEVISSLGEPSVELRDSRIVAYVCRSGTKWFGFGVMRVDPLKKNNNVGLSAGEDVYKNPRRV